MHFLILVMQIRKLSAGLSKEFSEIYRQTLAWEFISYCIFKCGVPKDSETKLIRNFLQSITGNIYILICSD